MVAVEASIFLPIYETTVRRLYVLAAIEYDCENHASFECPQRHFPLVHAPSCCLLFVLQRPMVALDFGNALTPDPLRLLK